MIELLSSPITLLATIGSLLFMLATTLILMRNRRALQPIASYDHNKSDHLVPDNLKVSVLIPARNEEDSIGRCVQSILNQSRRPDQLIVCDDQSTDKTGEILHRIQDSDGLLQILHGSDTPDDWLGKPWACHRLSQQADGDILIFLDADVWLEPQAVESIISALYHSNADMLTVWPQQKLGSPAERIIIPLVYHGLTSLLPITYTHRKPRWMPAFIYRRIAPLFAAACGQCIAFRSSTYQAIHGHQSVKSEIVEDVALAKQVVQKGLTLRMYEGVQAVHCRMYESEDEIRVGFRKNFFAGFNYRWIPFVLAALLHLWIFILPWFLLPVSIYAQLQTLALLSGLIILLQLIQRGILAYWFQWSWRYILTHPLGVLWFEYLGLLTMWDRITGQNVQWKGRTV